MNILGISAYYHDSAAAIIQKEKVIAAAQEERFTRKKHDPGFPVNAVKFCLDYSGLTIDRLDAVVFYDKPLLKFERLLETYYGFAPKGISSFIRAIPIWFKEKMFLKRLILEELSKIEIFSKRDLKLLFPEHHLSHAASAFYPSPYQSAAILTVDGVGEWATASIGKGTDGDIQILKELRFPHSLGLLYSAFTYYLGFVVNSGEYKMMGLAPYGNPNSAGLAGYKKTIRDQLVEIKEDGSVWLNQEYFTYATGLKMVNDSVWHRLFGFSRRTAEAPIEQHHCDLALAIQQITEEVIIKMAGEAKRLTGERYLCMAGGVALNCVANGNLLRAGLFEDIFIQPAAGDAGGALGAALAANYIYFGRARKTDYSRDGIGGAFLGPEFSDLETELMSKKFDAVYERIDDFDQLADKVADILAEGSVVGWHQGRMEFGPRALGGRSILGDPRNPDMQKKLNLKIKFREGFRPFAPSVLAEEKAKYFELDVDSPYMLLVADVKEERRKKIPDGYYELPLMERLYVPRSDYQAITHVDFSARIQTVHKETNDRYWLLIDKFRQKTGCGMVVNTSFNVRGEPIVCTPEEAYRCFMRTEMDYLVIGNLLFGKKDQPHRQDSRRWQEEFELD